VLISSLKGTDRSAQKVPDRIQRVLVGLRSLGRVSM
jgi:hypothetical protein